MNPRPPSRVALTDEPLKHVIEQYRHKEQMVTCVCGWRGSSATAPDGHASDWNAHLVSVRGKKR